MTPQKHHIILTIITLLFLLTPTIFATAQTTQTGSQTQLASIASIIQSLKSTINAITNSIANIGNTSSNQLAQVVTTNGLVGYWKFDEGSGTTAADSAGTNNGTLKNGVTWTTGQIGGALNFDGVDDYVDVGNNSSIALQYPMSVTTWVNIDQLPSSVSRNFSIIARDGSGGPRQFEFRINASNKPFLTIYPNGVSAGQENITSNTAFSSSNIGGWVHIAFTIDSNRNVSFYRNALSDGTGSITSSNIFSVNDSTTIGNSNYGNYQFDGSIDDVRIYNRALSASEIGDIYNAGTGSTTTYQCNDGIDNDSDGLTDYPNDPGCASTTDNDETNTTDTTPPTIQILSPTTNTTYSTSNSSINLSGTSSDDTSVSTVSWVCQSGCSASGNASGTTSWSAVNIALASGDNTIQVTATDSSSNTATDSITVTYTLSTDTTPPSTPTSLTATTLSSSSISLTWSASTDAVGVTGYNIYKGGTLLTTTTGTTYTDSSLSSSTSYTYTVSAHDGAGNTSPQSTSASATTQAQTTGTNPTLTFSISQSTIITGGSATLSWSSSNTVSCSASGGWSGTKATSGTETVTNITQDTTFTLTCSDGSSQTTTSVNGSEQLCDTLGANCVCSEPLNTNQYVLKGNQYSLDPQDTTGKECKGFDGVSGGVVVGNNKSSDPTGFIVADNDPSVLSALPAGNIVNYFIRGAKDNIGSSYSVFMVGLKADPTKYLKRFAWRYYVYHPPGTGFTNKAAGCFNTKWAEGPAISGMSGVSGVKVHYYGAWNNWTYANGTKTVGDCCWQGPPTGNSYQPISFYNGKWVRVEGVVTNRAGGASPNGFTFKLYMKNITDGTPEFKMVDTTIYDSSVGPTNDWLGADDVTPPSVVRDFFINNYREGDCKGYRAMSYYMAAGWDTDQGQRIGSAREVEGVAGAINPIGTTGTAITKSTSVQIGTTQDTTPPTTPTSLTATTLSSSSISLTWSPSTDAVGVTGYNIYKGGTLLTTTTNTSYTDSSLSSSTSYTYTVSAYDGAGNTSPQSTSASATTQATTDTTAPTISAPSVTTTTTGGVIITFTTNESTSAYIEHGLTTQYGTQTTTKTGTTYTFTISNISSNTTHNYRITATDAATNQTQSINYTFTTNQAIQSDTTAPAPTTNLSASNITQTSVDLVSWLASGDDGNTGIASLYDIRYSSVMINNSNWTGATQATGEPTPSQPGTTETYTLVGLTPGTTYYTGLKTEDEVPNISPLSNIISFTTLSPLCTDTDWSYVDNTCGSNNALTRTWNLDNQACQGGVSNPAAEIISCTYQSPTPAPAPNPTPRGGGGGGGGILTDTRAPDQTSNTTSQSADKQITLSWQNPKDTDYVRTIIIRNKNKKPISTTDGEVIYEGDGTQFTDTNLDNNQTYYYAIFTYDRTPNYSQPITITASPEAGKTNIKTIAPIQTTTLSKTLSTLRGPFSIGMTNNQVKILQQYLATDKDIYPEAITSGYYGALTQKAVQRFQKKHGIVSSGSPYTTGYGLAGPSTRSRIMQILGGGGTRTTIATIPTDTTREALIASIKAQIQELQKLVATLLSQVAEILQKRIEEGR